MDIIMYLIQLIQYQHKQICWLLNFICRYIPLKQWAFDDSRSPKYQKFKIDKLPVIKPFIRQDCTSQHILDTNFKKLFSYIVRLHKPYDTLDIAPRNAGQLSPTI